MALSASVVIVTRGGWARLRVGLLALCAQDRAADRVVVVDNGSRDETLQGLRAEFPEVTVIEGGRNLGFAAGANLGIQASSTDVVALLNDDAVAEPAFLGALLAPLETDARLGATAGTMVFSSAPEVIASAGIAVFDNGVALDRGLGETRDDLNRDAEVFGASAGAAAYRAAALADVGLFAESYFMYLEDVDLAWRLRLRGWTTIHAAGAVARHAYSASAGEGSSFKRRLLARNRIWTVARGVPGPLLRRNLHRILAHDVAAFGYGAVHLDAAASRGRLEGVAGLPARLRERREIQSKATAPVEDLEQWLLPAPTPAELLRLRRLTTALAANGDRASHLGRARAGR